MSLKDLTLSLPSKEVSLADGQKFTVRGLTLSDIATLVTFHGERLNQLYSELVLEDDAGNLQVDAETVIGFARAFASVAPGVVAHIIALAAREPGEEPQYDIAIMLPVDVQVDALDKAVRLTFQTEGGAKKVMETVVGMFKAGVNSAQQIPRA